ncbi:heat shock protein DnaJ domain protein [Paraburkholderia atlantica]|uniref:Heat shock protein DnaJ domain protein n=1 Tax=Paraburkholderia atlantica TaxID=2654982 RepID=D5WBY1_PARAM|nr:DnaJ domain-containing protein [Paraburkholderia atlantica]ADG14536.1 heat shock protein DnaJ domain protein [Paraburkholderia atlantica]
MKIAILAIAALVGFWLVGAIVEHFQKKAPKAAPSTGAGPKSASEPEPERADPIEEACRVLQLSRPFTTEQLRAAYRQRMSQYHPDKVTSIGPEFRELAESKSKEINRAFDLLARFLR